MQLSKAINDQAIENNIDSQFCVHHHSGLMQEHEPHCQSGCTITRSLNSCNCTIPCHNWLPGNASLLHLTELNLDEKPSNNNFFEEADSNPKPAEPPENSVDTESEEKSELNSNHQPPETCKHGNIPDCLLPSNHAQLKLKP